MRDLDRKRRLERKRYRDRRRKALNFAFNPIPAKVCRCEDPWLHRDADGDTYCVRCGRVMR